MVARRKLFRFRLQSRSAQSNANQNQLYLMRPDGGEARKITRGQGRSGSVWVQPRWQMAGVLAGKDDEQQIWVLPVAEIETANHSS